MTQYSGLPNANTNKVSFSIFSRSALIALCCLVPLASSVHAQQSTIAEAIDRCSNESNSLQRLVCYDRLAKSMRQYSGLEESASAPLPAVSTPRTTTPRKSVMPVPPTEKAPSSPDSQFGLEHKLDTDELIEKLYAVVSKIAKNARDRIIITLDNGQIWRQTDASTLKVKEGDTIYVERGVLGAFYLGKDGLNRKMKVRRAE